MNSRMWRRLPRCQSFVLEQADVEGRNAHHAASRAASAEDFAGVELRQEQHRGAGKERHVGRHEQTMGVEDRQGVDQPSSAV